MCHVSCRFMLSIDAVSNGVRACRLEGDKNLACCTHMPAQLSIPWPHLFRDAPEDRPCVLGRSALHTATAMVAQQLLQHTVLLVFVASRQPPLLPVLLRHQQLQLLHSQRITPAAIKQFMCHNLNVCEHVCIVKVEHEAMCN